MSHISIDFSNIAEFDALSQSIAAKLGCEVSLVSVLRGKLLVSLGHSGVVSSFEERSVPEHDSICGLTVRTGKPLRVVDAQRDPNVRDIKMVKALGIGAYLGVPLQVEDGVTVGSICAVSTSPRIWQDSELTFMQAIAELAESRIERHQIRYEQRALSDALKENDAILSMLSNVGGRALTVHNAEGDLVFANAAMETDMRFSDKDMLALPHITRQMKRQNATSKQLHAVCPTLTGEELSVELTSAENGLTLAEWALKPKAR